MNLTFAQHNCEGGAVTGKGIDWWWTGRDANGDMEAVEVIAEHVYAAIREEWNGLVDDDLMSELPIEADVEWNGSEVENITDVRIEFEYDHGALEDPEDTIREIQESFTKPITLDKPLQLGENAARVEDKGFSISIIKC